MAINSVWPILQFKLCLFNLNLSTKIACSSLRDSRVCTNMKIKWEETGEELFPATAHFSQISRSYFRVPFPYASSVQSQSPDDENRWNSQFLVYKCRLNLALFHLADMFINKLKTKLNDFLQNDFKYKKNSQLLLKKCPRKSISSLGAKGFFFLFLTR